MHLDAEGAEDRLEKAQRLHDIAALVQHIETDTVTVRNARLRQSFEIAESYQIQYLTTPDYGLALHYLKRLFILREYALAQPITRHNGDNEILDDFSIILRRLIEEL